MTIVSKFFCISEMDGDFQPRLPEDLEASSQERLMIIAGLNIIEFRGKRVLILECCRTIKAATSKLARLQSANEAQSNKYTLEAMGNLVDAVEDIISALADAVAAFPASTVTNLCKKLEEALYKLNRIYCNLVLIYESNNGAIELDEEGGGYQNLTEYQKEVLKIFGSEFDLQLGLEEDIIDLPSIFQNIYHTGTNIVIRLV